MREIKHPSIHQWLRSAIPDSQQPISPIDFLFLKLPPPPCAVLLVYIYITFVYTEKANIDMFLYTGNVHQSFFGTTRPIFHVRLAALAHARSLKELLGGYKHACTWNHGFLSTPSPRPWSPRCPSSRAESPPHLYTTPGGWFVATFSWSRRRLCAASFFPPFLGRFTHKRTPVSHWNSHFGVKHTGCIPLSW